MFDENEEELEFVIELPPHIGERIAEEMRLEREAQKNNGED